MLTIRQTRINGGLCNKIIFTTLFAQTIKYQILDLGKIEKMWSEFVKIHGLELFPNHGLQSSAGSVEPREDDLSKTTLSVPYVSIEQMLIGTELSISPDD